MYKQDLYGESGYKPDDDVVGVDPLWDGLVAGWLFDEASGDRSDVLGNLTLTDTNTVGSTTGLIDNAADFVGTNSEKLVVASDAALQIVHATGKTFALWINQSTNGSSTFFGKIDSGYSACEYVCFTSGSGAGVFGVGFDIIGGDGSYSAYTSVSHAVDVTINEWHLIVAWYDPATRKANLQIDNGTVDTSAAGLVDPDVPFNGSAAFEVGVSAGGSGFAYDTGYQDMLYVFDGVLTSDERTALYNAGAGRAYPN